MCRQTSTVQAFSRNFHEFWARRASKTYESPESTEMVNRRDALGRFVGENLAPLTDRRATKGEIKKLRQRFFEVHRLSASSRFSNTDVAEEVVHRIVRARADDDAEAIIDLLNNIPYMAEELGEERLAILVRTETMGTHTILDVKDLARLTQEKYLSDVEERFRAEAEEKAAAEIEEEKRKLEQQRMEVESERVQLGQIKSELDSIPPDADLEALVAPQQPQSDDARQPWWMELGLQADPFPSNRGLDGFPVEQYEDVVVKTEFVKDYLGTVRHSPADWMGKSIVVLGEYGAGKTTLFELIAHECGREKYLPVVAVMTPDASISKMRHQFLNQVRNQVNRAAGLVASDSRGQHDDDIAIVIEGMVSARRTAGTLGFLVFVDGLHKTRSYQTQCLEFLQQLQSVQERIHAEGISCGFLIAGGPAWDREFEEDPALSGSFYRIDRIPPLGEENAVEAVVRRIHAQVTTGRPGPSIVREPLRTTYRILSQRLPRQLTFRDYLDHIRERFVKREFSDLGVTVSLHGETIETVLDVVSASNIKHAHGRLSNPNLHSVAFRQALRTILPHMYERRGIDEDEDIFRANQGAFYALHREGLIVSRRRKDTTGLRWFMGRELVSLLTKLNSEQGILPSVALEAMFADKAIAVQREKETVYGDARARLNNIIKSQRQAWPELSQVLVRVDGNLDSIEEELGRGATQRTEAITQNLNNSVQSMMLAVAMAAGGNLGPDRIIESFTSLWCSPENAESMVESLRTPSRHGQTVSELYGTLHLHGQQVVDLCVLVSDLVRGEAICRLNKRTIIGPDKQAIHEARVHFLAGQYARAVDATCTVLEARIRDVIYPALRMTFGPKAESAVLDAERLRRTKQLRSHPRLQRSPDSNFLFHVNRSDYPQIVFQRQIKQALLAKHLNKDQCAEMKTALELAFSLDDRAAHRDRDAFFRKHATEVGDVIKTAPRFLELLSKVAADTVSTEAIKIERSDGALRATFAPTGVSKHHTTISAGEVEAGVKSLLDHLTVYGGRLGVPPLDELLQVVHTDTCSALALVGGCGQKELVSFMESEQEAGIVLKITDEGKNRLQRIERAQSF